MLCSFASNALYGVLMVPPNGEAPAGVPPALEKEDFFGSDSTGLHDTGWEGQADCLPKHRPLPIGQGERFA